MTNLPIDPERAPRAPTQTAASRGEDLPQRRAREAAEALFRRSEAPMPRAPAAAAPGEEPRKPRIIAIPPATPRAETPPDGARPAPPAASKKHRAHRIVPAEYGRIRILATHGMTLEQVAELYGVTVQKIARIVGSAGG